VKDENRVADFASRRRYRESPPQKSPSQCATTPRTMPEPLPSSFMPWDALLNNPLFAGGLGLAGLGATAALVRRSAIQGASLIKRCLLVDVEISKQEDSYNWILAWISLPRPQEGFITSKLTRIRHLSMKTTSRGSAQTRPANTHFFLQSGYGKQIIRFKNAYIQVNREKQSSANMTTGEPHEIIDLIHCFYIARCLKPENPILTPDSKGFSFLIFQLAIL
jgi:hypothetical protein